MGGCLSVVLPPLLVCAVQGVIPSRECCICESGSGRPLYTLLMKVRQASRSSNMTVKHI